MQYLGYYLLVINLCGAFVAWWDKYCAKHDRWRVPEKTLFLFCLLGGSAGVYLCMRAIHHKTLHKRFMLGIPAILFAQLVLCALVYRYVIYGLL